MYSLRDIKELCILLILLTAFLSFALSACGYQTSSTSIDITSEKMGTSNSSEITATEMNSILRKTDSSIEQGATVSTLISGNMDDSKAFYPRIVELDNGDLLATFMRADPSSQG